MSETNNIWYVRRRRILSKDSHQINETGRLGLSSLFMNSDEAAHYYRLLAYGWMIF